jgi:DNA helicase-2/ATP-dependent DNA helicase PcrA
MGIADPILQAFPSLNEAQKEAISHTEGPVLVIAGPGSGKTLVLILRTLNLLLQGLVAPSEILLCAFTEKAAFELRDRLSLTAKKLGYEGDLASLLVGTIHSIANEIILRYRHYTPLGDNYEVLDDLTQLLFIYEYFDEIIGVEEGGHYLEHWTTRWTAVKGARDYFNKITEELVDPERLQTSTDPFVSALGRAYISYRDLLFEKNRIDFPHQQKLFLELLNHPEIGTAIKSQIRYLMVDEYQDSNYIQERLYLHLVGEDGNICVVGDDDQSLYRFRGATVRNILEFPKRFFPCYISPPLSINYRSHRDIISAYNKFMDAWDWSNPDGGTPFRFDKTIEPDPREKFPDYPAVFAIWGTDKKDEARRFADLVSFLKRERVIEDESQVALLLHSVRQGYSGYYLRALEEKGIRAFCPRARAYFENDEVRLMVGSFAILLGYYGEARGDVAARSLRGLADYVDGCIEDLARAYADPHPLAKRIQAFAYEIESLREGETLDRRLADYFYQFLACEPFASLVKNENRARNLAIFSQLLNVFQTYYHYTVITARNRESLRLHFFNSFLRLLYEGGINEYEDPNRPLPKGYVQVMTIHQAKGLEFPVVVVGSLDKNLSSQKQIDRVLGPFYHRPPFEPEDRITGFDRMRLHYVAFSRAQKILVLTTTDPPKEYFNPIWQNLPQWPYVEKDLLKVLSFELRERMKVKKTFSFTRDVKAYETCPRQYQFFRAYEFAPARSAEYFFGALVHQTIEDIHRRVLAGKGLSIDEKKIEEFFAFNYRSLINRGFRPIGPTQREAALSQVLNYYRQNKESFPEIVETEVDVSVEKENYILTGRVDLLLGNDNKLKLLDFKSQPRPVKDEERLDTYYKQLCVYAHVLEQRYGKRPERLMLYWTGEERKEDALMVFPYKSEDVAEAGVHFDRVVAKILAENFSITRPPEPKVCQECDLRAYCEGEGMLRGRREVGKGG